LLVSNLASVVQVDPRYTSKTCSRCGVLHKSLRSERVFECPKCGFRVDRQLNASINVYLRMRGDFLHKEQYNATIAGGFPLIEAETSDSDELTRKCDELRMPQVYVRLSLSI
jgi:transposase